MPATADKPQAPVAPFLAASLILIDRGAASGVKILLGRRHQNLAFLPGKFVFPGGRCEAIDAEMSSKGSLHEEIIRRLCKPSVGDPATAPAALALTGFRELFEESGYMVGARAGVSVSVPPDTSWAPFGVERVIPNLSKVHYIARALTPPHKPRRFNTHFFAIDVSEVVLCEDGHAHADAELVELRWVTLEELAKLDAIPVTHFIAEELAKRLAAGFSHDLPVPFFYMQDERWIRAEL